MIESWVLVEEQDVNMATLRSVSLANPKHLVVGRVPGSGVMLHVAANSPADLASALLRFTQVPGVTGVFSLALRNPK